MVYSITSSSSLIEVETIGLPNSFTISRIILLSGTRIPTVLRFLNGLGKFTKTASALLIMAISGGAILPLLYGKLVDIKKTDLIKRHLDFLLIGKHNNS